MFDTSLRDADADEDELCEELRCREDVDSICLYVLMSI